MVVMLWLSVLKLTFTFQPEVVVVEIPVPKSPSITAGTGTETTSASTSAGTATTAGSENPALTFVSRSGLKHRMLSCYTTLQSMVDVKLSKAKVLTLP